MSWYQIVWALVMAFMIWRLLPVIKQWKESDQKGSSKDWMTAAMLLGGVVLFVIFLMMLTR